MQTLNDPVAFGSAFQKLVTILQSHKIFAELPSDKIEEFTRRADFRVYKPGERVITKGAHEENFYIVISGELEAKDTDVTPPRSLRYHEEGEILGMRALLRDTIRAATVDVTVEAVLAVFDRSDWDWLSGQDSRVIDYFDQLEREFDVQARFDFPGRRPDEVVVRAIKRHPIAFVATLPMPLSLLVIPVLLLMGTELLAIPLWSALTNTLIISVLASLVVISGLIILYRFLDWWNDDFIITTKRVVMIERFLFYGEERHEAPLTQIQNVTIKSHGVFDLIFDVDDMVITTAGTAPIVVENVSSARLLGQVILDEQVRAKARVAFADVKAIRQLLDKRLRRDPTALPKPGSANLKVIPARGLKLNLPKPDLTYFVPRTKEFRDIKKGDKVEKKSIVWRKHYFILLAHIILPVLALIASGIALFFSYSYSWLLQLASGAAFIASLAWYIWEYDGWRRDIYIVTDTRIVDVESSSFRLKGEEQREGSFDSIQDINYQIPNFFYKVLNLGDVIIRTAGGGKSFTFRTVFNPSSVQEEIFNRWDRYQQQKREKNRDDNYKQVVDVVGEYHDEILTSKPAP